MREAACGGKTVGNLNRFRPLVIVIFGFLSLPEAPADLVFVETDKEPSGGGAGLSGATHAAVSPGGEHVYVASQSVSSVVAFSRDMGTGALTSIQVFTDAVNVDGAQGITVSPDGKNVYAVCRLSDNIVAFTRDTNTGMLTFLESHFDGMGGVDGLSDPIDVVVSSDGVSVYVAGFGDDAIAVFDRDAGTGALTFVEIEQDGVSGVDGLQLASSVYLSPDNSFLYATGLLDDAIAIFSRDSLTGELDYLGLVRDGVSGVDGLDGASGVVVSNDGNHVYASAAFDDAVAMFERDSITGMLTFLGARKQGVDVIGGLDGANGLAISPNDAAVFVAGLFDHAVVEFIRNPDTGLLKFVEAEIDGVDGVDGLEKVARVTVSPDGSHLYAAAVEDSAVTTFSISAAVPFAAPVLLTIIVCVFGVARLITRRGIAIERG